jgi:hypothetical protein
MVEYCICAEDNSVLSFLSEITNTHLVDFWRTFSGVMIVSTFFVFNSKTPFNMLISSSRKGSSPVL